MTKPTYERGYGHTHVLSHPLRRWSFEDQDFWRNHFPDHLLKRARRRAEKIVGSKQKPRITTATIGNERAAMERYFGFLKRRHPRLLALPFIERFGPQIMEDYKSDFEGRKPQTIADNFAWLYASLRFIDKEKFVHVREIGLAIPNRSRKSQKPPPAIDATELLEAAVADMNRLRIEIKAAAHLPRLTPQWRTPRCQFRNSLMVAILIADVLRRKNFVDLTIDDTFFKIPKVGYEISIPKEQLKDQSRDHDMKIRSDLNDHLDFYLETLRADFQCADDELALFLSVYGNRISYATCHAIITTTTERLVGERLTTHDFRKLIADLTAVLGLSLGVARDALNHSDGSPLTERVYTHKARTEGRRLLKFLNARDMANIKSCT